MAIYFGKTYIRSHIFRMQFCGALCRFGVCIFVYLFWHDPYFEPIFQSAIFTSSFSDFSLFSDDFLYRYVSFWDTFVLLYVPPCRDRLHSLWFTVIFNRAIFCNIFWKSIFAKFGHTRVYRLEAVKTVYLDQKSAHPGEQVARTGWRIVMKPSNLAEGPSLWYDFAHIHLKLK